MTTHIMIFHLASVFLGPLLYAQGKYVRRVTPKLPEAEGVRAGTGGIGPTLSLLITGDSAAAGVGVAQQDHALSGRLVESLSNNHNVNWKLLAESGLTSARLLEALRAAPAEPFEWVVMSIGVNDVTALTRPAHWQHNLQAIIDILQDKFSATRILLTNIPPMHIFPVLPQPLRWWLGLRARRLNQLMADIAEQNSDCRFAAIPYPLEKHYIAEDGFHPGGPAYKLWGEFMAEMIIQDACDN